MLWESTCGGGAEARIDWIEHERSSRGSLTIVKRSMPEVDL